jgi:hypothetical protein
MTKMIFDTCQLQRSEKKAIVRYAIPFRVNFGHMFLALLASNFLECPL